MTAKFFEAAESVRVSPSAAAVIIAMAVTTYLVRMIPFTFFNKKIKSRFVRSFLKYIPFAVLSAMTIPDIFYSTGDSGLITAAIGAVTALVLSLFELPLIVVASSAAAAALVTGIIVQMIK